MARFLRTVRPCCPRRGTETGKPATTAPPSVAAKPKAAELGDGREKQSAVSRLIQFYANRGHLIADIDPLGLMQRPMPKVLDPAYVGLTEADMNTEFHTASRTSGVEKQMRLSEILKQLRHIYTGRIGAEFAHVSTSEERLWLQDRFQDGRLHHRFTTEERLNLLWQLSAAEGLERYLHTKYVGQKRFSLEGGDALIPLLDDVVQRCGASGVEEIVIGMAASRPAQCPRQRARQVAVDALFGVRGQVRFRGLQGLRRRQVSQGILGGPANRGRQRACRARIQSLASRGRRCGRRGFGPRTAGAARRRHGRERRAAPDSRRRGVCRAGRRRRRPCSCRRHEDSRPAGPCMS